ncbi:MAG TPA: CrcB family protein [Propionibacteriaceae bacterium]|nr:CrcB family protein [Propionibacteriaceae bacterium]
MSDPERAVVPTHADRDAAGEASGGSTQVHLSWSNIALVVGGGVVGTGLRYLITLAPPRWAGVPIGTLGINVVGAFLLGALLELLADRSLDAGWSRRIRLAVGTGCLGGFTTYSALAADTVTLAVGHPFRAVGYASATVVLGAVASVLGIWLSRGHLRPALIDGRS